MFHILNKGRLTRTEVQFKSLRIYHSLLRNLGVATLVEIDGEVFGLMGGGISPFFKLFN